MTEMRGRAEEKLPPQLSERDFRLFRELIGQHCGISIKSCKRLLLQNRIGRRLRALNLQTFRDYHQQLTSGDEEARNGELSRLWSAVTTGETHFFREPHHFETLHDVILPRLTSSWSLRRQLRVWSAGCASGQEPYTLAMVLDGWSRERYDFQVLGSDIDEEALRIAREGRYPAASRHEIPASYATRYLELEGEWVRMGSAIRRRTRFALHNFATVAPLLPRVDVIFCRNAMMYLRQDTRARLLRVFADSLVAGGCLVAGTAERVPDGDHGLSRQRIGKSTVLLKTGAS